MTAICASLHHERWLAMLVLLLYLTLVLFSWFISLAEYCII